MFFGSEQSPASASDDGIMSVKGGLLVVTAWLLGLCVTITEGKDGLKSLVNLIKSPILWIKDKSPIPWIKEKINAIKQKLTRSHGKKHETETLAEKPVTGLH